MLCKVIRLAVAVCVCAVTLPAQAASLDGLAVEVSNASEPVLCAEKDNVTINLQSSDVRRFRIEAAHPAYIGTLQRDSFEADWTACDIPGNPQLPAAAPPKRTTLYEDIDMWVVGLTFPTFWRPATATVRIGDRVETGLHLLQVWMIRPMGGEEVLVFYPQDGYWRLRPLAPAGMAPTAFGSSFLVGPVEIDERPIVRINEVAFDPKIAHLHVAVRPGRIGNAGDDEDRIRTAIFWTLRFDRPISGRPFATLRSMFVTEFNNDVARIAVREKDAKGWREDGIMSFKRATATDVWAGRIAPSRHNTSSPDMVFGAFSDGRAPAGRK